MVSQIVNSELLERNQAIRRILPELATEELAGVMFSAVCLLLCRIPVTLMRWHERSWQRTALRMLDDRLLHDVGLTRDQARMEYQKWFWQR